VKTGELCNREVVIATPEENVSDAARRMIALHVGALVVTEEIDGLRRPIGIVTDRDLVAALVADEVGHARALEVADVMSRELLVSTEDEDVFEALQRMRARGVRRLPIVNEQRALVGILTFDDIVEWLSEQLSELTRLVQSEQRHERTRD
jgi:CBS domain-containing protein